MRSVTDLATQKQIVFYDELSNFNPLYAYPEQESLLSLELEVRYHIRNLRLLSIYFDHIIIMMGNILNFTNHTTKTIVVGVMEDHFFRSLADEGIIVFGGWGETSSNSMIDNQVAYALSFEPGLKDKETLDLFNSIMSSGSIVIRDSRVGEFDFTAPFLCRLRLQAERLKHLNWERAEVAVEECLEETGYIGTLELFPKLQTLYPELIKAVNNVYFDVWLDYAAKTYAPAYTYENSRTGNNAFRKIRASGSQIETDIASALLSPPFLERFLRKFFSDKEYRILMDSSAINLSSLRTSEWKQFQRSYMRVVVACSKVYWMMMQANPEDAASASEDLMFKALDEIIRNGNESVDIGLVLDFLVAAAKEWSGIPGLGALIGWVKKALSPHINRELEKQIKQHRLGDFYPFVLSIRRKIEGTT